VLKFKITELNGYFFSLNDTDNLQMSHWTLQEAAVHVKELHLFLSTVRLMCGIHCRKGSIHFCNGKIRALSCLENADSCASGTVLADENY
jgi:hypothetical protein